MKKLISMTDFVLEQKEKRNCLLSHNAFEFYRLTTNYANFLKQPLTLSMFIPIDENGCVLEEPNGIDRAVETEYFKEYQNAKSNVLFDGFFIGNYSKECTFDYIDNKYFQFRMYYKDLGSEVWKQTDNKLKTIEDLIPYKLTLTDKI